MEMGIIIKVSISMECLKDLGNIFGQMEALIKEISSKDKEVVTVFGRQVEIEQRATKVITIVIRKMDMVFIHGTMVGSIRETLIMIFATAMDSCLIHKEKFSIKDFGIMDNKQIEI